MFDHFQGLAQGVRRRIRAVVESAIFLDATDDGKPWKIFLDRQSYIRVLLVIPQHDVEAWFVALDQVALQYQRFELGPGHHGFEVGYLADEHAGLSGMVSAF